MRKNLRTEIENLQEQDRLLRMKAVKLYAKVEFVRKNNKIVGYVISAVNVVLAGMEIAVGMTLISTMTPLGVLAGAVLVTDGTNGISKEVAHYVQGNKASEGLVADAAMSTAEFMGFSPKSGLAAYKTISSRPMHTAFLDCCDAGNVALISILTHRLLSKSQHNESAKINDENCGLRR